MSGAGRNFTVKVQSQQGVARNVYIQPCTQVMHPNQVSQLRNQQLQQQQQQQQQQYQRQPQNVVHLPVPRVQGPAQSSRPLQVGVKGRGEPLVVRLVAGQQWPVLGGNQPGTSGQVVSNQNTTGTRVVRLQLQSATSNQGLVQNQSGQSQQTRPVQQVSVPLSILQQNQGRGLRFLFSKNSTGQQRIVAQMVQNQKRVVNGVSPSCQGSELLRIPDMKGVGAQDAGQQQQSVSILRTAQQQPTGKRLQQVPSHQDSSKPPPRKGEPPVVPLRQRSGEAAQTAQQVSVAQPMPSQQQVKDENRGTLPLQHVADKEQNTPYKPLGDERWNSSRRQESELKPTTVRSTRANEVGEDLLNNLKSCVESAVSQKVSVYPEPKQRRRMLEELKVERRIIQNSQSFAPLKQCLSMEELWQEEFEVEDVEPQMKRQKSSLLEPTRVVPQHFGNVTDVPWWIKEGQYLSEFLEEGSCCRTVAEKWFLAQRCHQPDLQELMGNGTDTSRRQHHPIMRLETTPEKHSGSAVVQPTSENCKIPEIQSSLYQSVREFDTLLSPINSCRESSSCASTEKINEEDKEMQLQNCSEEGHGEHDKEGLEEEMMIEKEIIADTESVVEESSMMKLIKNNRKVNWSNVIPKESVKR